jgi:hypothetical protein
MNRPTRTEAHYYLRRQVIFSDPDQGAQLIADSEARATRKQIEALEIVMARWLRAEAAETVALANWNGALERAMKAEADLAAERSRLNWLDQQGAHYGWKVQLPADYPNVKECVFVCRNTTSGHKTIREAIDAAMKEGK